MTETEVNTGLINFINSVDGDLGRDPESLNLFEWVVEDHYEDEFNKNAELFAERPDLLHLSNERIQWELDKMLHWFLEKEEYEKCARIKIISDNIFNKMKKLSTIK